MSRRHLLSPLPALRWRRAMYTSEYVNRSHSPGSRSPINNERLSNLALPSHRALQHRPSCQSRHPRNLLRRKRQSCRQASSLPHGGPGGSSDPKQRRYFHPEKYRIVNFDQRGCGKSTPYACLEDNTTWALVSDIEKIREHLGIERWQVFGGSWGLLWRWPIPKRIPTRVTELVLRGIFLLRKQEIDWFYQRGASILYPDTWEPYVAHIPESERGDMLAAYYRRLTSDDPKVRITAAKIWSTWEGSTSKLLPDAAFVANYEQDEFALAFARIEAHYFANKGFLESDGQLWKMSRGFATSQE